MTILRRQFQSGVALRGALPGELLPFIEAITVPRQPTCDRRALNASRSAVAPAVGSRGAVGLAPMMYGLPLTEAQPRQANQSAPC
jgi:hypothetical protein